MNPGERILVFLALQSLLTVNKEIKSDTKLLRFTLGICVLCDCLVLAVQGLVWLISHYKG